MFICLLPLFVSVQLSDAYVKVLSIIVFFSLNYSFLDKFLFLNNLCAFCGPVEQITVVWTCTENGWGVKRNSHNSVIYEFRNKTER
jgi:hypothetical protein